MSSQLLYFFRSIIIGEDQFILSQGQYKRILLTGQLCLITVVISLVYVLFDFIIGRPDAWPYQITCATLAFISFVLNRRRNFTAAKFLLGISSNATIFLFAISQPIEM